jgi:putative endonuclease
MNEARRLRGALARRAGRRAELAAALWLMAKGYRILALRHRTPQGEIDVIAQRGRVLAAVEVKARPTLAEALDAVRAEQRMRLRRALEAFAACRNAPQGRLLRLDLIALAPGRFPRHIADAWTEDAPHR